MAGLEGLKVKNTYKSLLRVNDNTDGIDATAKYIGDGEGTASSLSISTGNIGIGTAVPKEDLHISDGTTSGITSGAEAQILITDDGIPRILFEDAGEGSGDKVMAITNYNENLVIQSMTDTATGYDNENILVCNRDGNVGIGTVIPNAKLEASGDIFLTEGADRTIKVTTATSGGTADDLTVKAGDIQNTGENQGGDLKLLGGDGLYTDNTGGNVYIAGGADYSGTDGDVILAHTGSTSRGKVGIGTTTPLARLHVDQSSASAAVPALYLDQADVSEEMIRFESTIGSGNAVELKAGGKIMVTTHFIRVKLAGGLERFLEVGTLTIP